MGLVCLELAAFSDPCSGVVSLRERLVYRAASHTTSHTISLGVQMLFFIGSFFLILVEHAQSYHPLTTAISGLDLTPCRFWHGVDPSIIWLRDEGAALGYLASCQAHLVLVLGEVPAHQEPVTLLAF